MTYTPTAWLPGEAGGTLVTAEALLNMEDQLVASDLSNPASSASVSVAATYATKAALAATSVVAYHLGDAAYTRPTTSSAVLWIGSVTPTNMINGDVYLSTVAVEPSITWHTSYSADTLGLADLAAVASLTDTSGNGRHATQAVAAKQPIFHAGAVPYIRFDGVDDFLRTAAFAADLAHPMTLVCAVRMTTITTASSPVKNLVDGIAVGKTINYVQRGISGGAGTEVTQAGVASLRNNPTGKAPVAGQWTILTFVVNNSASYFRVDGVQTAPSNFGANVVSGLTLGANYATTGSFADYDLGDLRLAAAELTPGQVIDEEAFLAARYSVTLG